jgi:hypothetical protein
MYLENPKSQFLWFNPLGKPARHNATRDSPVLNNRVFDCCLLVVSATFPALFPLLFLVFFLVVILV